MSTNSCSARRQQWRQMVRRTFMSLWIALLISTGNIPLVVADSRSIGPTTPEEMATFLDAFIPQQLADEHIAGAAVAVVKDGQLFVVKGYGLANIADQKPVVAEQTLFRTDSVGKLFVWTAVMQLAEQGKLDLDADINTYLDFQIPATYPAPITLKHLMSHSAGFEDLGGAFALDERELEPVGVWLANNIPARVRAPGIVSSYSNYGTALAGYIVERVSGQPFQEYAEEHIFAPLGMQHSTFRQPLPENLAVSASENYQYADGKFQEKPFMFLHAASMGEGHVTVTDMAKFMVAHLAVEDSPILKATNARQMHSQLFRHDPRVSGFAYGFAETTQNNQRLLRHEGNNPGVSSTSLFLLPDQGIGVYVAYNSNGGFGPGTALRQAFLDHYYPAAAASPQPVNLTAEQSKALVGSYRSTRMFHTTYGKIVALVSDSFADIQVSANQDGTFTTQGVDAAPLHWTPIEPQVLRLSNGALNGPGDLVFDIGQNNQAKWLYIGNNPYRAYKKVAWYEAADFQRVWLVLCEVVFLFALPVVFISWLVRRRRPSPLAARPAPLAQWLLVAACGTALIFPLGLLLTLEDALVFGNIGPLLAVLAAPLIAIVFTIGSLLLVRKSWGQISQVERVPYVAVFVAMAAFTGWLHYWNLLGFRL